MEISFRPFQESVVSDIIFVFAEVGKSRQPWAGVYLVFFFKSMKGEILNFLHEVEKMISVISVEVNFREYILENFTIT